jgi:hypothetical protein
LSETLGREVCVEGIQVRQTYVGHMGWGGSFCSYLEIKFESISGDIVVSYLRKMGKRAPGLVG